MGQNDIDGAIASSVTEYVDYSVSSDSTDGATGNGEFRWYIEDWNQNLGYYKNIPELQTAVDAKAVWTIGAGFEAEEDTSMILSIIKGNGNDSFNGILANMIRVYTIAGDSFAEIMRDKDDVLVNLKPLDPSSIVIVSNSKGMIIRYEQITKFKEVGKRFTPDQILHLSRKRIADEVHGISVIPSVEFIIKARNEAMSDWKTVLHRNVYPLWIFHLDTDDTTEIAAFKAKNDSARANGENMYITKGAVVPELVSTATNSSLNPLNWINQLNDYFFQAVNVPQIVVGNGKEFTDASGKIVYLAYEQSVKGEQLYIEEQILAQLNIAIDLVFPASLQNEAISDTPMREEEPQEEPIQEPSEANDEKVEMEGKQ